MTVLLYVKGDFWVSWIVSSDPQTSEVIQIIGWNFKFTELRVDFGQDDSESVISWFQLVQNVTFSQVAYLICFYEILKESWETIQKF